MHRQSPQKQHEVARIERDDFMLYVAPGGSHFLLLPLSGSIHVYSVVRQPGSPAQLDRLVLDVDDGYWDVGALRHDGGVLALNYGSELRLYDRRGRLLARHPKEQTWGDCAALSFSASGETLWASFEAASQNVVAAYDGRTFAKVGEVSVGSETTDAHLLRCHPAAESIVIQLSGENNEWFRVERVASGLGVKLLDGPSEDEAIVLGVDGQGRWYRSLRDQIELLSDTGTVLMATWADPAWATEEGPEDDEIVFEGIGTMVAQYALTLVTTDSDPDDQEYRYRLHDDELRPVLEVTVALDKGKQRPKRQDGLAGHLVILSYEDEFVVQDWSSWLTVPTGKAGQVIDPVSAGVYVSDEEHELGLGAEDPSVTRLWLLLDPDGSARATSVEPDVKLTRSDLEREATWQGKWRLNGPELELTLSSSWGSCSLRGTHDKTALQLARVVPMPIDVFAFQHCGN